MSTQEDKLKAIADAIREKEGSTAAIPAKDFPARILALETGGLPEGTHTIEVKANVSSRGTVSGGGLVTAGMKVTVSAAAKNGYQFTNWTENGSIVSADAEYAFPIAKDRTLTAVFNAKPASRLPAGYTEVEYIQSDRVCGINTGLHLDVRYDRIVMDIEPTDISRLAEEDLCAMKPYTAGSSSFFCVLWRNMSNQIYGRFATASAVNSGVVNGLERMNIDINLPVKKVYINEDSFTAYSIVVTGNLNNEFSLFAPGTSSTWGSMPAKLYSAKTYRSGALTRDFVPCVNASGVVGLYDLVESQFYQNSLTGTFTAGPEI